MTKRRDLTKARAALTQVRSQYSVIKRLKDESTALEKEKAELKRSSTTGRLVKRKKA